MIVPIPTHATLIAHLREQNVGEAIIERIVRLNPVLERGKMLRGYHRTPTAQLMFWTRGFVSRTRFCRRYGREAWDRIPPGCFVKHGKRKYLPREAMEDQVWHARADDPAWFLKPRKLRGPGWW